MYAPAHDRLEDCGGALTGSWKLQPKQWLEALRVDPIGPAAKMDSNGLSVLGYTMLELSAPLGADFIGDSPALKLLEHILPCFSHHFNNVKFS